MANKRIRSRKSRSKEDLIAGLEAPASRKPRRLARQSADLSREIHRLECLIADAPRLQKQTRMSRRNTLPPPDEFAFDRRGALPAGPRPLHARKLQQKRRLLLLAELTLLLLAAAAIAGWSRQWMQW